MYAFPLPASGDTVRCTSYILPCCTLSHCLRVVSSSRVSCFCSHLVVGATLCWLAALPSSHVDSENGPTRRSSFRPCPAVAFLLPFFLSLLCLSAAYAKLPHYLILRTANPRLDSHSSPAKESMSHSENIELRTKDDSKVAVRNGDWSDQSSMEKQTRTRRLFSGAQLFAFSLTYMSVWEGMCG